MPSLLSLGETSKIKDEVFTDLLKDAAYSWYPGVNVFRSDPICLLLKHRLPTPCLRTVFLWHKVVTRRTSKPEMSHAQGIREERCDCTWPLKRIREWPHVRAHSLAMVSVCDNSNMLLTHVFGSLREINKP
jgi:hypothetical protein